MTTHDTAQATDADILDVRCDLEDHSMVAPRNIATVRRILNRLSASEKERDALRRALLHCYDGWQSGDVHISHKCDACKEVDELIEAAWGKDRVRG